MKVPPKLSELLSRHELLHAETTRALGLARPWFEDNKVVFFPEYTDHGPRHVQDVLDSVEGLITDEAWSVLSPEDAAVVTLGALLHDCAMHLSKDGFVTLLTGAPGPLDAAFDDRPWPQLWDEFMAEARRFDERKLKALFDRAEPAEPPPLDPLKMTEKDCLLIGEFLRRHHARLAHEIAVAGVPGPAGHRFVIATLPWPLNDLAGVVARSHGLDLRACVDYFDARSKSGAGRTGRVHVTYLMALLRVADYLQIHRERAPGQVLEVRSLRSPVSRGEWRAHHAITDMHQETHDPDAIWVEAAPRDVNTYLKLKHLFKDLQRELDESWAVLGEVYASNRRLRGLGLSVRRIKSTLDDEAAFARTVKYIPRRASLETAGAELLKLLIAPLYGNDPSIGVRELLQNAVDACRELKDYRERNPGLPEPDVQELPADVDIYLASGDDGGLWLNVSDRGIGMTADVVLDYFLKAGASFRSSDAWWKRHADAQGETHVLRSGRFGIGVLAGFLLGPEIQVKTRHVTAPPDGGISFTCRLDDDVVQLDRVTCQVGTSLRVRLSDDAAAYFGKGGRNTDDRFWDWYCLAEPSVRRSVEDENEVRPSDVGRLYMWDDEGWRWQVRQPQRARPGTFEVPLKQRWILPSPGGQLPPGWRRFKPAGFQECQWTYRRDAPPLVCNGIHIGKSETPFPYEEPSYFFADQTLDGWFRTPSLSVFDPHGRLPLNLQRTALNAPLPFRDELLASIHRDLIAYLLVKTPGKPPGEAPSSGRGAPLVMAYSHAGLESNMWYWYAPQGVSLFSSWHVEELAPRRLFVMPSDEGEVVPFIGSVASGPVVPFFGGAGAEDAELLLNRVVGPEMMGQRVLARRLKVRRWDDADALNNDLMTEWEDKAWVLLGDGDCPPLDFDPARLSRTLDARNVPFLGVYYPLPSSGEDELSPIEQTWREVIGLPYIPYDPRERRALLGRAYKELAEYVEAWERSEVESSRERHKGRSRRERPDAEPW